MHAQMLHVWNIYLHLHQKYSPNVGKYSIHGAFGMYYLHRVPSAFQHLMIICHLADDQRGLG